MTAPDTFTLFAALPPELRVLIWTEALTEGSVWELWSNRGTPRWNRNHRAFWLINIGPSPHIVGQACREARRVMEHVYGPPFRGLGHPNAIHWINTEDAVLVLNRARVDSLVVQRKFGVEAAARFQHVALVWSVWESLELACVRLAASCPHLQTIIVRRAEEDGVAAQVDAVTAARLSALRYEESVHDDPKVDSPFARQQILQHFESPVPRLHLVGTRSEPVDQSAIDFSRSNRELVFPLDFLSHDPIQEDVQQQQQQYHHHHHVADSNPN